MSNQKLSEKTREKTVFKINMDNYTWVDEEFNKTSHRLNKANETVIIKFI